MTRSFTPEELMQPQDAEAREIEKNRQRLMLRVMTELQELKPDDLAEVINGLPLALKREIHWLSAVKRIDESGEKTNK